MQAADSVALAKTPLAGRLYAAPSVCAWCEAAIRETLGCTRESEVSHGLCPRCVARLVSELAAS